MKHPNRPEPIRQKGEDNNEVVRVPLNRSGTLWATVDATDFDALTSRGLSLSWNLNDNGSGTGYVKAYQRTATGKAVSVSRVLLDLKGGQVVRYVDSDPTNLRRSNLAVKVGWAKRNDGGICEAAQEPLEARWMQPSEPATPQAMTPDTAALAPPSPRHAVIHTDGSCAGNPGPGGWAATIRVATEDGSLADPIVLTGGVRATTNNRMEVLAAIEALKAFPRGTATVFSDSQYLIKGITEWVRPWKSRGWKNAEGKKVKNRDLWEELEALTAGREIVWTWVKGHAGHRENEEVDGLANAAANAASLAWIAETRRHPIDSDSH